MNIVIAGAGVAGITAAEAAREADPKADIIIFSRERDLLYFRPRLPEVAAGKVRQDAILVHPAEFYREKKLDVRLGESLADIDLESRQIRGTTGSRLLFDRLLLACGAESNRPPLPGAQLPGVFAVRSLPDAVSLYYEASRSREAVLVGSGLLGLEMGYALTVHGIEVNVLERSDRILPRQTTPRSAAKLQKILEAKGFRFHLGRQAVRAEGRDRLEKVVLDSGEELQAQILLLAAGIVPNLDLARLLKLKIDRAVTVDEYLETSIPGIYAAGDCAQSRDGFSGLWTISRSQGLIAGANMAAPDRSARKIYEPVPPSTTLKAAGVDLTSSGNLDPGSKLTGLEAEDETSYRKVVLDSSGLVVGFTNLGTKKGNAELAKAVDCKVLPPEIREGLTRMDFDFSLLKNLAPIQRPA
ncbi:MAG: FAD-dependent oxidoreductase [Deltaproteobacteria bacterium]|jgi:nitrite reductase (NADH) large subunit|nr:FAD-dependent oxidoreductase [Deltaproteobacteria bacterium]